MTQRFHYDKGALGKATAPAASHLTPLSRPPSRLPQCQPGTHSPGTHTAKAQALLHGSQNYLFRNEGKRGSILTRLFPLSSSLGSNSLLSPLTACGRAGGSNYLLTRLNSICLVPIRVSLSFPSQTRCFFVYSQAHHAHTYIHTYPRPRTPPIHGFVTVLKLTKNIVIHIFVLHIITVKQNSLE